MLHLHPVLGNEMTDARSIPTVNGTAPPDRNTRQIHRTVVLWP